MPKYRIICVNHEHPHGHAHHHNHIISVGTGGDPRSPEKRWTLAEVLSAMDQGEEFFTKGEHTGRIAEVEKYHCHTCGGMHIRTKPDHVHDNNLDALKQCPVAPVEHHKRHQDDRPPQPDRRHG